MHPLMRRKWQVKCNFRGQGLETLAFGDTREVAEAKAGALADYGKMRCCTKAPRGVKAKRRCFDERGS